MTQTVRLRNRVPNPNTEWLESPSGWVAYLLGVLVLRIFFAYFPYITSELAWTLTNVSHSFITLIGFHWMKGAPFDYDGYNNPYKKLTFWEQIDGGLQYTATKKFLTLVPVGLFLVSTLMSHYNLATFMVNFVALMVVVVAKFPQMHGVRIFGINK